MLQGNRTSGLPVVDAVQWDWAHTYCSVTGSIPHRGHMVRRNVSGSYNPLELSLNMFTQHPSRRRAAIRRSLHSELQIVKEMSHAWRLYHRLFAA